MSSTMSDAYAMWAVQGEPLTADELARMDAHWRAANYLSVGQI